MLLVMALRPSTTGRGTSPGLTLSRSVLRRAEVSRRKAQLSEEVIVLVVVDARRRGGYMSQRGRTEWQPSSCNLCTKSWLPWHGSMGKERSRASHVFWKTRVSRLWSMFDRDTSVYETYYHGGNRIVSVRVRCRGQVQPESSPGSRLLQYVYSPETQVAYRARKSRETQVAYRANKSRHVLIPTYPSMSARQCRQRLELYPLDGVGLSIKFQLYSRFIGT